MVRAPARRHGRILQNDATLVIGFNIATNNCAVAHDFFSTPMNWCHSVAAPLNVWRPLFAHDVLLLFTYFSSRLLYLPFFIISLIVVFRSTIGSHCRQAPLPPPHYGSCLAFLFMARRLQPFLPSLACVLWPCGGLAQQASLLGGQLGDARDFGWRAGSEEAGAGGGGKGDGRLAHHHDWESMVQNVQNYIKGLNFKYRVDLRSKGVSIIAVVVL